MSGGYIPTFPPFAFFAGYTAATAATITAAVVTTLSNESSVVAGGQTIIITLTNDTWETFDNTIRQAIIDGLDSNQSELLGWNAEVRDKEVVGAVVRTSPTVVTITLSAAAAYDITANETIVVTVPAAALVNSAAEVTATPTFSISFEAFILWKIRAQSSAVWAEKTEDDTTWTKH